MSDYISGNQIWSILGDTNIDQSLNELLNISQVISLVPETTVQNIEDKHLFNINEGRDNFDYIYKLSDLTKLEGKKYKKIRNKSNNFTAENGSRDLSITVKKNIDHLDSKKYIDIDRIWANHPVAEDKYLNSDGRALEILLSNADKFDLLVIEIMVDGEIKAFSINEILNKKYAICHFEKVIKSYHANLSSFFVTEVAKKIIETGCSLVNWEQDLGLEGLRQSKMSYNPTGFLKKYTISRIFEK